MCVTVVKDRPGLLNLFDLIPTPYISVAQLVLFHSHLLLCGKGKGKVFPLQARRGPEGGYRYSSTLP